MYIQSMYSLNLETKFLKKFTYTYFLPHNNTYIQKNMGSYCLQLIPKDTLKDLLQFKKNLGVPV